MPHRRINSKWIKDFNVRLETIKMQEQNISSQISDIAHSNILSDTSSQARETNKQKKWYYIKLKCFFTTKDNNKIKRKHLMGKHICQYI